MASRLKLVYDRLQPDERFRLVLEAAAREDLGDLAQLANSCPRRVCEASDPEYVGRIAAVSKIAHITTSLILQALLSLQPHAITRDLFDALRVQWNEEMNAAGLTDDWPDPGPDLREACEKGYRDGVASLLAICEGVERFCKAVKIKPTTLLAMNELCLHYWRHAITFRGDIDFDQQVADELENFLLELWPFRTHDRSDS